MTAGWRTLYLAGCLLYLGVTAVVMGAAGISPRDMAVASIANALPPSLLGIAVVHFYRQPRGPLAHLLCGVAFTLASVAGSTLILYLGIAPQFFQMRLGPMLWGMLIAGLLFVIFASGASFHRVQTALVAERERVAAAEASRARAELAALRARIDPHFLFNTLHSLLSLVRQDPGRAEEAIEQFADILRYTFSASDGSEERTLRQEWHLVENYLALERLRLGARLRVEESLAGDVASVPVPVLTLQPLVENAIRHAIAPRANGGRIEILARREDGAVRIDVSDDGPGASAETLAAAQGSGLHLVRERLERFYRGAASMELGRAEGGGMRVTIRLPEPPATPPARSDTAPALPPPSVR